jgi:hypothetical protein
VHRVFADEVRLAEADFHCDGWKVFVLPDGSSDKRAF